MALSDADLERAGIRKPRPRGPKPPPTRPPEPPPPDRVGRPETAGGPETGRTFDLDDVAPPDTVVVNGVPYALGRSGGLSIVEQARLARAWKRIAAVDKKTAEGVEATKPERLRYREDAETIARLALPDATDDVVASFSDDQLARLILVYFTRAATTGGLSRTIRELLPDGSPPISAATSPSSSTRTAATL